MNKINLKGTLKGIAFSVIVIIIMMLLVATVSYFFDISDKAVNILIFIGMGVGIFAGAYPVSKNAESKSFFHGVGVGIGILLVFLIFSAVINKGIVFNSHHACVLFVCLFCGAFGGLLGKSSKL